MVRQLGSSARLLLYEFTRHPKRPPLNPSLHEFTVNGAKVFAFSLALKEAEAAVLTPHGIETETR
jgi:hypothetical protein